MKAKELLNGNTRSCGCLFRDAQANNKRAQKHGLWTTPEWGVWAAMKARCINPEHHAYKDYGGRGIKVCQRWVDSFTDFLADMGKRPSAKHEIDRFPDNNGDYTPENCRWATRKEQMNNTRRNHLITYNGETKSVSQWSETTGIPCPVLIYRHRVGWDTDKIFTVPVNTYIKRKHS